MSGKKRSGLLVVAALMTMVACSGKERAVPEARPRPAIAVVSGPPSITVAADVPRPASSQNGLLAGFKGDAPADAQVAPLHVATVRGWPKTTPPARVAAAGARYVLLLSDAWGYPPEKYPGGGGSAPQAEPLVWQQTVSEQAAAVTGDSVVVEPLNEPDNPDFFAGTEDEANLVWLYAFATVRRERGAGVEMAGPSLGTYDRDRLQRFLEFCLSSGCRVNWLSWHELVDEDTEIDSVGRNIVEARTQFVDNPRYASLGLKGVMITEWGTATDLPRPGENVGYLAQMEAAGSAAAMRSCFAGSSGVSNCYDGSLDGLLSGGQPTPAWWVAAAYAKGVDRRLVSLSVDPRLAVIAAGPGTDDPYLRLLVGRHRRLEETGEAPIPAVVQVGGLGQVPLLAKSKAVRVQITRYPDTAGGPMAVPKVERAEVEVREGSVEFTVPKLAAHEAVSVELSPA